MSLIPGGELPKSYTPLPVGTEKTQTDETHLLNETGKAAKEALSKTRTPQYDPLKNKLPPNILKNRQTRKKDERLAKKILGKRGHSEISSNISTPDKQSEKNRISNFTTSESNISAYQEKSSMVNLNEASIQADRPPNTLLPNSHIDSLSIDSPSIEPKSKRQRLMETANTVGTLALSIVVRNGSEALAFSQFGFNGLFAAKAAQMGYDYMKGNTYMLSGNIKLLSEAVILRYGTPSAYLALKVVELSTDIYRRSWLGAADTIFNILPNDTLTLAAMISNQETRSRLIAYMLENRQFQQVLYMQAQENAPLYQLAVQLSAYDLRLAKLIDHINSSVQRLKAK